jgi:acetate kinase
MKILVLNAGSSSQKSALYDLESREILEHSLRSPEFVEPLWTAEINWTATADTASLSVETTSGSVYSTQFTNADRTAGMQKMLQTLWSGNTQVIAGAAAITCVGHRVVHGGQTYSQAVRIDAQVKATIAALSPLAPDHNHVNLEGINMIETVLGTQLPQFAVFDTAFHRHMPDAAAIYPGPYDWVALGIRRYGFHGISHQYCADRLADLLKRDGETLKLITCHLGNGCSLAAIQDGQSIDTTMGFTPLEGLMMGSRSGSVDPGILLYLMREQGLDAATLDDLLNHRSGLKGLSGVSHDLRLVQAARLDGNPRAQLAWDVYIHRIRSGIGAMLMSLGGVDAVGFTAGVGEQDPAVRSAVCEGLGFLGLTIDEDLNQTGRGDRDIAKADSSVRVWVLHTQEDWQIAKSCWELAD